MEIITFWTAAAAVAAVVAIVGGLFGYMRHLDWRNIESTRMDIYSKIHQVQLSIEKVERDLATKVEKDQHNKDISLLRDDLKQYTNRLDTKLDRILDFIMEMKK
jgi:hypothetical protein